MEDSRTLLLEKLPDFDSAWSDAQKDRWFSAFKVAVEMDGSSLNVVKSPINDALVDACSAALRAFFEEGEPPSALSIVAIARIKHALALAETTKEGP